MNRDQNLLSQVPLPENITATAKSSVTAVAAAARRRRTCLVSRVHRLLLGSPPPPGDVPDGTTGAEGGACV
jgi:hypothetical protein